jgi:hypothetical protein
MALGLSQDHHGRRLEHPLPLAIGSGPYGLGTFHGCPGVARISSQSTGLSPKKSETKNLKTTLTQEHLGEIASHSIKLLRCKRACANRDYLQNDAEWSK